MKTKNFYAPKWNLDVQKHYQLRESLAVLTCTCIILVLH